MDVRGYVESHAREFFDELKQWPAIPEASAYLWQELAAIGPDLAGS